MVDYAERVLSTRRGAILVAVGAAVLAGILLLVYVRNFRHSAANTDVTPVLVATSLIEQGTPGNVVGTKHLYEIKDIPKANVLPMAFTDPSSLNSAVATTKIFPGAQFTPANFAASTTSTLVTQITGRERALTLPIDATRTLGSQLAAGDKVDIYISLNGVVHEILQNVPVLIGGSSGTVTVKVDPHSAALLALAVDTGKIWFSLRPAVGAPRQLPTTATQRDLLR